jgi:uncharacterized protein YciU (UPF0263 family)
MPAKSLLHNPSVKQLFNLTTDFLNNRKEKYRVLEENEKTFNRKEIQIESPLYAVIHIGLFKNKEFDRDEIYMRCLIKPDADSGNITSHTIAYDPTRDDALEYLDSFLFRLRGFYESEDRLDRAIKNHIDNLVEFCKAQGVNPGDYVDYAVDRLTGADAR